MSQELSQKELEELVNGKPSKPVATFFEKAVLNVEASKKAGRRIYDKKVFIKVKQPGVTDWTAYIAQKSDVAEYYDEYQNYLDNRQGTQVPGVEIIPNLDIAHLQELIDIGLAKIPQLAAAKSVPPHLEYARLAAVALNNALQEQSHEEESIEEESIEETREAHRLPETGRQEHPSGVRRSDLPAGHRHPDGEVAQGLHTSGRFDGGQRLIDSFQYDFEVKTRH